MSKVKINIIILLNILFTIYTFYPGQLSIDSIIQLKQAQTFIFNDWQPPIMSFILYLFSLIATPTIVFISVQILCFNLGSFLLYQAWQKNQKYDWTYVLISILPPIFTLIGTVWKDVFFSSLIFLVYSSAEYIKAHPIKNNSYKLVLFILVTLLISIAQMFRANGLFLTFFIYAYFIRSLLILNTRKKVVIYLICLVQLLLTFWFNQYFNYELLKTEKTRPMQYTMFYDLVGISYYSKNDYIPEFSVPLNCDKYKLTEIYDYHGGDNLFSDTYYNKNACKLNWVKNDIEYNQLKQQWLNAIKTNPYSYITHRLYFFTSFLKLDSLKPNVAIYINKESNEFGIDYNFNYIRKIIIGLYYTLTFNPFFYPWFYFIILIFSQFKKNRFTPHIDSDIFAGCILYMLSFAIFGPGQVYRYTYPIACILTSILMRHFVHWLNLKKRL